MRFDENGDRQVFCPDEAQTNVEVWLGQALHIYRGCEDEDSISLESILTVKLSPLSLANKSSSNDSSYNLKKIRNEAVDVFILLRQEYSWGHLLVTEDIFAKISSSCNAFPALGDHVASFASKTSDRDEHFSVCDRKIYQAEEPNKVDQSYHEICYLLRYPARHGRNRRCPFSLRQMAIYQRFDYDRRTSTWILVQAPPEIASGIRTCVSSERQCLIPSNVHERIFSVAEQDWRDYICYLDDDVRKLEDKASFVDVEFCSESDYLIAFADSQKLQQLHRKLVKAKEILDCCLEVASGCETHWQNLQSRGMSDSGQRTADIGSFVSRIKMGKLGVEAIQKNVEGIATLLFRILDYRNQNTLVRSNEALHRNSDLMREIAIATKAQNELMAVMVGKSQKDSHTIKILTVIALIYLPASLVAEVFNSNLIQTTKAGEDASGSHLTLSHSFWIYPVTTFCLMLFTFLPISWLLSRNKLYKSTQNLAMGSQRTVT